MHLELRREHKEDYMEVVESKVGIGLQQRSPPFLAAGTGGVQAVMQVAVNTDEASLAHHSTPAGRPGS